MRKFIVFNNKTAFDDYMAVLDVNDGHPTQSVSSITRTPRPNKTVTTWANALFFTPTQGNTNRIGVFLPNEKTLPSHVELPEATAKAQGFLDEGVE